jgi:Thrombospondin type 3 repeat
MRRLGVVFLLVLGLVAAAPVVAGGAPLAPAHPEPGDVDGDGVRDENDNCPQTRNGNQANFDGDSLGDRCDDDADNDDDKNNLPYLEGGDDNCPLVPNPGQEDTGNPGNPGNGIGDACDRDDDGDLVTDAKDNCPGLSNPDQADYDYDRVGDACDPDEDEDGEFDEVDNCVRSYNPLQEDADGDGIGTWCDDVEAAPRGPDDPGDGGPRDARAPAIKVALAGIGRSVAVEVRADEACSVRATLTVDRRTARRLRIGRTVATGTARLGGEGTTYVFMRLKGRAARRLAANRAVRAQLQLTASDAAGNQRPYKRAVRLRR